MPSKAAASLAFCLGPYRLRTMKLNAVRIPRIKNPGGKINRQTIAERRSMVLFLVIGISIGRFTSQHFKSYLLSYKANRLLCGGEI